MQPQKQNAFFKWLNRFGTIGNIAANTISFLTANWGLAVSAVLATFGGLWTTSSTFFHRADVQTIALIFLALFWTYIGFVVLSDRKKPRETRPFHDYRYGLTFEGIFALYNPESPEGEGTLSFAIQLRNFSSGPLKYEIEVFDVIINNRILPRLKKGTFTSIMSRGAGRTSRHQGFKKEDIKDFLDKQVKGTLDLVIVYGHPERDFERRLKMSFELGLLIQSNGPPSYSDTITSESDEPI